MMRSMRVNRHLDITNGLPISSAHPEYLLAVRRPDFTSLFVCQVVHSDTFLDYELS